jgi:hypothetical protein
LATGKQIVINKFDRPKGPYKSIKSEAKRLEQKNCLFGVRIFWGTFWQIAEKEDQAPLAH